MSHDRDYAYWSGNTTPWPYVILARDVNAFSGSFLLPPKSCVQPPIFNHKSNQLHQLNRLSASRTVRSSFYSTAINCSLWADCCFPNYERTSSPALTRNLILARVFIIRVKTGPPTHLKTSLDISTNISTSRGAAWRPKCRAGLPNATAAELSSPSWFFSAVPTTDCHLPHFFAWNVSASLPSIQTSLAVKHMKISRLDTALPQRSWWLELPLEKAWVKHDLLQFSAGQDPTALWDCNPQVQTTCQTPFILLHCFHKNMRWLGPGFSLAKGVSSSHCNKKQEWKRWGRGRVIY